MGEVLFGAEGSSQAKSVIQRAMAGFDFFEEDAVVRLDVETVDATEAFVVVSVLGIEDCWGGACATF